MKKSVPSLTILGKKRGALKPTHYLEAYEERLSLLKNRDLTILEVGVAEGGSLKMWRDYFPNACIIGIDSRDPINLGERINVFKCDQMDSGGMEGIGASFGPLDLVIDDGAHVAKASFWTFLSLFPHVSTGGLYVIEDWGTGYWPEWPDGDQIKNEGNFAQSGREWLSHQSGMVGFIKQLVDICNTLDRTRGAECSQIASMEIMPGMVFLRKR